MEEDELCAVRAVSRGVQRTLVDGTVRLVVDIDPYDATKAFSLFGVPGTPMVLAKIDETMQHEAPLMPAMMKGGSLANLAGRLCRDPEFWKVCYNDPQSEQECSTIVREMCGIKSRAELDHNKDAADKFNTLFRYPFIHHCVEHNIGR